MRELDLISIIVPVYNVEDFLVDCLQSIINQTYQNLEIIVIDDGSSDASGKICDDYALKDKRIIVYHQKNQGLGPARNVGMLVSKGKYLIFVDSDDYIHPRAIEILYESIKLNNSELAMASFMKVFKYEGCKDINNYTLHIIPQRDLVRRFYWENASDKNYLENVNAVSVWNKLYKRELLHDITFRNIYHEDVDFSMAILLKIKEAVFVDVPLYFWLQRRSSISHEPMNNKRLEILSSYKYSLERIPKIEKDYRGYAILRLFKMMLNVRLLSENSTCRNDSEVLITELYNDYHAEFFSNKSILLKDKIGVYFMYSFPSLYKLFIKLFAVLSR